MTSVALYLNTKGYEPWTKDRKNGNKIWKDSYIRGILSHPALYGALQPAMKGIKENGVKFVEPCGEIIENYYPAIITKEEFDEIKALRVSRRRANVGRKDATRKSTPCNLFPGVVYAEEVVENKKVTIKCRWTSKGATKKEVGSGKKKQIVINRYNIYYVPLHPRLGNHLSNYHYRVIEDTILSVLTELKYEDIKPDESTVTSKYELQYESLQDDLNEVQKETKHFIDLIGKGKAPSAVLKRIGELEKRENALSGQLNQVKLLLDAERLEYSNLKEDLQSVIEMSRGFDQKSFEAREMLKDGLGRIIKKITLSKNPRTKASGLLVAKMLRSNGADVVKDPMAKRKGFLGIHIEFVGGARRAIIVGEPVPEGVMLSCKMTVEEYENF